jgi:O-antigen/teichoic acid export membrane protein
MALAPQVARLYSAGEIQKLQRVITLSTRVVAAFAFPAAVVFIVWGEEIIALVFGDEYVPAAMALTILCLGQLVNASAGSVALVLNMTGNERSTVLGVTIALIVNFMLSIILIPLLGLVGAAIGFSVSLTAWNITLMIMAKNKVGINTFWIFNDS